MSSTNDAIMTAGGTVPPSAPPVGDIEYQAETGTNVGVTGITARERKENLIKKGSLVLRGLCFLFSVISFSVMARNSHGFLINFTYYQESFNYYDEYRYLVAIGVLSAVYTIVQVVRQVHESCTRKQLFHQQTLALIDFIGDQIMAYLLLSAASSAVPRTSWSRGDDEFYDYSAVAVSFAFLAFFALAISALISSYRLSTLSCI
ncbi:hypothetical protein Vadar_026245 [Vaccinium darrowii]|uniref:Uncharacterized protein n=1 Tax=Vaccinium darrowii TaxID=229202 RepID=A0ACB7ZLN1_9ERIC|nr:hypothetical protein Vadar_026245 [Vaccinium darrowii]